MKKWHKDVKQAIADYKKEFRRPEILPISLAHYINDKKNINPDIYANISFVDLYTNYHPTFFVLEKIKKKTKEIEIPWITFAITFSKIEKESNHTDE
jgi:hypothetical protein